MSAKEKKISIPQEVAEVIKKLDSAGFESYIVGGCVRDLLTGRKPKDWDITTSAKPEEIMKIFPDSFYENKFLTVTVKIPKPPLAAGTPAEGLGAGSEDPALKEVEITTFRAEGRYTDKRHPDEIRFAKTLEEDLARRDFTVNAIAISLNSKHEALNSKQIRNSKKENPKRLEFGNFDLEFVSDFGFRISDFVIIDPLGGRADLENKFIRAVGDPDERFNEDALRMVRAVRLASELGFEIEKETEEAIKNLSGELRFIAKERIRDEFSKIIMTDNARQGIENLQRLGLLKFIMPELEAGIGVENRPRIFTVWEHGLKALEYGVKVGFSATVRLAALLHDIGKPPTRGPMKNGEWTFYGHDVVGARIASQILERLHFPREEIEKISVLIRWHLFKYDPDEGITDSSVRRLIRHVGAENMNDLVRLRICDRMGMGVPKAVPYRLRHFQFRVEKILREEEVPTPKMLKINGDDIMKILDIPPGKKIGHMIEVLMQEVIDNLEFNTREHLEKRAVELGKLSDEELVKIAEEAETKVEMVEEEHVSKIKEKYYVK